MSISRLLTPILLEITIILHVLYLLSLPVHFLLENDISVAVAYCCMTTLVTTGN